MGEIKFSDSGVCDVISCTVGVENFSGVTSATFTRGRGNMLGTAAISNYVCVLLVLARGQHCDAERAIYWTLPRISSLAKS